MYGGTDRNLPLIREQSRATQVLLKTESSAGDEKLTGAYASGVTKEEWEALGLEKRVEWENLRRAFEKLDRHKRNYFDKDDLAAAFKRVGYRYEIRTEYGISEAEDIIWEMDEDDNGFLDWEVFVTGYVRCRDDKTGREPKRLYNLIEFLICDKDNSGTMSEDECAEVLFNRFGKAALAADASQKLFQETAGEINFQEFLTIMDIFQTGKDAAALEEKLLAAKASRGKKMSSPPRPRASA
mmetsp:Transcript_18917/g.38421  ORF Transcript_18917/g.38421 Transcript_18917/m.38421 type:complete len:240 (+) Transcript_18917:31-750(+)